MSECVKILHFPNCESTNSKALLLAAQGAAHGTVVLADRQTKGRGRGENCFISPEGGLYMSVILRPVLDVQYFSLITLAAGLSCVDVIEKNTGILPLLKWPNDLYVHSLKLAGILTETSPFSQAENSFPYVVVGIGMNINTDQSVFDSKLCYEITSLYQLTHERYELELFAKQIVLSLNGLLILLRENPAVIISLWRKKDFLFNKTIAWSRPGQEVIIGTAMGVTNSGQYRIRDKYGQEHFILGGHLRPAK